MHIPVRTYFIAWTQFTCQFSNFPGGTFIPGGMFIKFRTFIPGGTFIRDIRVGTVHPHFGTVGIYFWDSSGTVGKKVNFEA